MDIQRAIDQVNKARVAWECARFGKNEVAAWDRYQEAKRLLSEIVGARCEA